VEDVAAVLTPETLADPLARVQATGSMVPPAELLPDVLPDDRLLGNGRPRPEVRAELRRIPNLRNVGNVASCWVQSVGVIALAVWIGNPITWVLAFLLMGRAFALFAILSHEAAHRTLFSNRRANDWVGRWLLAYPAFVPLDGYRRSHMAHHRDEMGPEEPDISLYARYPIPQDSLRRKLTRDAFFISGWKNLKGLLFALKSDGARPIALRILGAQLVLFVAFTLAGYPLLYPLLWLAPWMTVWRVINRLRSIAEHGGMVRSADRRETTHHVRQGWLPRFWMVPFNTGWHLAHHVDIGVPFQHLPALHDELVTAGWVVPEVEYRSYRQLWKALASG
jgi:fatty acid desaturase